MYNFKHTFYRFISPLLKLTVVTGCFYFIYHRLFLNDTISLEQFSTGLSLVFEKGFLIICGLLTLSLGNWLLEILKWQTLVNSKQKLKFEMATKQCLSALTVSLMTPNRVGDYAAKAIYYPKNKTKSVIGLNAIGQFTQLFISLIFGIFGCIYMYHNFNLGIHFNFDYVWILATVILMIALSKKGRFYSHRIKQFYKSISLLTHIKVLVISLFRYLIFSHQFYFLMVLFNLQAAYFPSMMAIFSMYLLASMMPSISVLDWAIKGSAAVFVFGFLHVKSLFILEISLLMWTMNFAIPALIGSFYVLKFRIAPRPFKTEIV